MKRFIIIMMLFLIGGHWADLQAQINVRAATIEVEADTIIVPIFIDNMNAAASLSLTLSFDNSALNYLSLENTATFGTSIIANVSNGQLFIAWFSLSPVTVVTDTLVRLKFVRGTGCFSDLNWDLSSPGANQITDINGTTLPTVYTDGLVSFLIEDSPVLESPTNLAQDLFIVSSFQWTNAECFVNYRFQIDTDTLFNSPVIDSLIGDTMLIAPVLNPGQIYHWRVAKVDTRDSLDWSDIWTFTTGGLATIQPQIPVIKAFADTIIVPIVLDSLFDVTDFDLLMRYDSMEATLINVENTSILTGVNINTSVNGELRFDFNTNIGTSVVQDTLAKLTFVQKGCQTTLTWDTTNAASQFTYLGIFDLPVTYQDGEIAFLDNSAPNLLTPINQQQQVFFQPDLTWNTEECVENYQLQLALDASFTNIILDTLLGNDTLFQAQNLADTTTYYWRVARIDLENSIYWSPTWDFRTESTLVVSTKAHSVATYNDTLPIAITIDSLQDAAAFELYLDYDANVLSYIDYSDTTTLISGVTVTNTGNQIKIAWSSLDSTVNSAAVIVSDTILQLRFEKIGGCYSDLTWNVATQFTHIIPTINLFSDNENGRASFLVLDAPTALTPNNTTTLLYPQINWSTAVCAENYQLQIATDNQFSNIELDTILNDTTLIPLTLAANTTYFWRALKQDTEGDIFASDTLTFTTGDAYESALSIESIISTQSNLSVPVLLDSLYWMTDFQLIIEYNASEVTYTGFSNPLFNSMTITENNGLIAINYADLLPTDVVNDTLIVLNFDNKNACISDLEWNANNSIGYYINGISTQINYQNGELNFLNTDDVALRLPPDNSVTLSETPTLNWNSEVCSDDYQIEIAEDTFFTNIILTQTGITDTFYVVTTNLIAGTDYFWRVGRMDNQGTSYISDAWKFRVIGVSTTDVFDNEIAVKAYPNPFREQLIIEADITSKDEFVNVQIFDINGRLAQQEQYDGTGNMRLNINTSDLSSGIYILKIQTKNRFQTVKLVK
ncbi:MAG: T9SS type A sorting domain-containing protein [Saprospiraceae bacterium]